jgi:hypothetical protein
VTVDCVVYFIYGIISGIFNSTAGFARPVIIRSVFDVGGCLPHVMFDGSFRFVSAFIDLVYDIIGGSEGLPGYAA